tara:strand:+ start:272 stop:2698 length:2427 start_codon:yes stop_codon:yes gene_type:complete
MQTKNKIFLIIIYLLNFTLFNTHVLSDEFDISALEVIVDKKNNTIIGKGSVEAIDSDGRIVNAEKIIYKKDNELLEAEGSVKIFDKEGNTLRSNKATYDKINELVTTYGDTELEMNNGYNLISSDVFYDIEKKIMNSEKNSTFTDKDGNVVDVDMFQYQVKENLFSSIGNIKIVDINKNKYHFKELHVDTKKNEMIGSDVSILLDQKNFGLDEKNDPRILANDIFVSKNKTNLSRGVFTVCKIRKDKCPPWAIQAKEISHDKIKKTIYYDHAILKFYDIPIFYFPKFFHPDPTVKRQSGFLSPFFTDSSGVGTGFGLPYYWAINKNRDLTFTPKIYAEENLLYLNEYRQAFKNGFLTIDTSYTSGYKNKTKTQTDGSRNHFFTDLFFNLGKDKPYDSNLSLKIQRTSNDTYFRVHDINTALVDSASTDLTNEIGYQFSKDNMYVNVFSTVHENLREDSNSRYEYILPNIMYGKTFFSDKFGVIDFKSNALHRNYDVNKHTTFFTNDIIWNPGSNITKKGFVNTIEGIVSNRNYNASDTTEYKNGGTINELSSVISLKSSLPMRKDSGSFFNIFSPNFMVRYAPGHMRNLSEDDTMLNYANLYSMNKTSEIEDGLSAILGFDFTTNEKMPDNTNREKLSVSLGQVFNIEENKDMPARSSLDQKTSDVVGEMNYNFSKIGKIGYKFSLDHNFEDFNYNEISTDLIFGKVGFNLDYLEEQSHIGTEHYVSSGVSLNFSDSNKLSFSTKKNFKTDSTELYDISYQYTNDCLTAGLVFRREFYEDNDVEKKNTLMFTIKFVPFTGVKAPILSP